MGKVRVLASAQVTISDFYPKEFSDVGVRWSGRQVWLFEPRKEQWAGRRVFYLKP